MKKLSFMLLALLAVTLFTSCNKEDEQTNKYTYATYINNRAIDGDEVVFSQGTIKVELDIINNLLVFNSDYKDVNGKSHTLVSEEMKLQNVVGNICSFNSSSMGLEGFIDKGTGVIWFQYSPDGATQLYSTTDLLYAYTTTSLLNPESNNHGEHQQSAYLFALDATGETCVMKISNFIPNINGAVEASEIQYSGLKLTPTTTGYVITADEAESSYKGFYTITDLNFVVDNQCRNINGSFKCNGLIITVNGSLFETRN